MLLMLFKRLVKLLAFLVVIELRGELLGELSCVLREGRKGIASVWGACVERLQQLPEAVSCWFFGPLVFTVMVLIHPIFYDKFS